MLIARAPLRISFAGGGTDLEAYYGRYGGMVVSATINRYFYVIISSTLDDAIQLTSADFRMFERRASDTEFSFADDLGYLKSILHEFGVRRGLSVFTASEIPPGTGLGSSSTVAVAMIKALSTLCQRPTSKQEIAELSSYIEIIKLGRPIGLQDQYAAAFGGLNAIRFTAKGTKVSPVPISLEVRDRFERSLMLFFTGSSRNAATILTQQRQSSTNLDPQVIESLHGIRQDAHAALEALQGGDLHELGRIMHNSWQRKKKLASGISNERIDRLYTMARERGAVGGKIAGAGGGGFLMLFCDPENQDSVTEALEKEGLARMTFHFDDGGAQVLVNSMPEIPGLAFPEGRWTVPG